jgi:hypothetical protein
VVLFLRDSNRRGRLDAVSLPEVTTGIDALRRDNPWPELPAGVAPFYLSLDAGGRHLVTDAIRENGVTLMLEIGCFLCGSTRQWLDSSPDLEIIGVDPWDGNWSTYFRKKTDEGHPIFAALENPLALADTIQRYGNYRIALNNIRDDRDRFIPVRRRSPKALHYLRARGIQPQLIYIDALKSDEDLWVAHDLFPRAILCGDDWNWPDDTGRLRMREHVERFAAEKGFTIEAEGATWLIPAPPPPAPPEPWNEDAARALVAEVDDAARALLRVVATAAASGDSVTFDETCHRLGCGAEDLLLAVRRINVAPPCAGRPQALGLGEAPGGSKAGRGTGNETGDLSDSLGPRVYVLAEGLAPLLVPHL